MTTLKKYFSFGNNDKLTAKEVYKHITLVSVLEVENFLNDNNINSENVYFKLISQIQYFEKKTEQNKEVIAYLYYIIGYYVGLFLHPMSGDEVAINYLNKSISIDNSRNNVIRCKETIDMINEV
ncbi:hypothetical protein ERUR111494_08125 [Erysipelothrix urinaevulpis]|uniref:hypothetical protein n=1 Tax=Erysipelothrix urinaevulpis TaxID=2683717 RepID=UPI001357CF8A|nr:hypothetical protein [Erysipelothrix urinaevulpis]